MTTPPPLPAPGTMKLRYITTRKAVLYGSLRVVLYNRALMTYTAVLLTGIIALDTVQDIHRGHGIVYLLFSIGLQAVLFAGLIAAGLVVVTTLHLLFGRGRGVLGEHELLLCENGLMEKTEYNESLHKWKAITRIRETPRYYFIRVNETNGSYHLVPRHDRVIEGEVEPFIAELRARLAARREPVTAGS